ncbi:MAG: hypothetical protein NTZ33_00585 [Bacteroidetes bacterium]|nr:hypothetical protein [Bacteroidota bacterium]
MKHIIKLSVFLLSFILIFSCKTNKTKTEKLITERIQYDVCIKSPSLDYDWWIQNIEGPQRDKFINFIFNAIDENKVKIYNINHQEVSLEHVVSNLFTFDTIHLQDHGRKKQIIDTVFVSNTFDLKSITKVRFDEKWSFDEKTLMVSKDVKGFCPMLVHEKRSSVPAVELPLFWIYADTNANADTNNKFLITKKIQYDVNIISNDKSCDWWVNNIETSDREYFLKTIIDVASKGKLRTYDFFMNPLDKKKFAHLLHHTDTVLMQRLTEPYENFDTIVKVDFDQNSIVKIRFVEEWSLNTQSFKFYKKVLAICPMIEGLDDKGNVRGYTPLFWIFFDESIKNAK